MRIRPNILLTSDTHFGHERLISLEHRNTDFEDEIVEGWNSVVSKQDVVLHLGDLTMVNKDKTKRWTQQLRGRKYLILGNHDTASEGWYRDCGFTVIPDAHEAICINDIWYDFVFTHEPVFSIPDNWFNIHGHLHGNSHRGVVPDGFRHFDVGVDAIGYKPIRFVNVIDQLLKLKLNG